MASSKTTTKKKTAAKTANEKPVEFVAVPQQPAKRKPAARRVPVQYTPRIPTARCPGC